MSVRIAALVGLTIALAAAALALAPPAGAQDGTLCVLVASEQWRPALEPVTSLHDLHGGFALDSGSIAVAARNIDDSGASTDLLSNDWLGPHDGLSTLSSPYLEYAFWDHYGVDDQGTTETDDDLHKYWVTGASQRFGCLASSGCTTIDWPAPKVETLMDLFNDGRPLLGDIVTEDLTAELLDRIGPAIDSPGGGVDAEYETPDGDGGC